MEIKGQIYGSVLPLHLYIGSGDETQVVRLGGKPPYPPSRLDNLRWPLSNGGHNQAN